MARKRRDDADEGFDVAEFAHIGEMSSIVIDEIRIQRAHRRSMDRLAVSLERRAMEAAIQSERLGIVSALFVILAGLGCATTLVATGHGWGGATICSLAVTPVSAFIWGRTRPGSAKSREQASSPN